MSKVEVAASTINEPIPYLKQNSFEYVVFFVLLKKVVLLKRSKMLKIQAAQIL